MIKKYKVLIHLDELQRDYVFSHWIGSCLENLGFEVAYCTRLTRKYLWRNWKPHAMLDSHIGYHSSESELKDLTSQTLLFLLPAEGLQFCVEHIHVPYSGLENDKADYLKYLKRIFLWGEWQKSLLEKRKLFPPGLAIVTGNPKYDGINEYKRKPAEQRSVGIVGFFNGINIFDDRNFLDFVYNLRNRQGINFDWDGQVEDFIWYQVGAFRLFMQVAEKLIEDGYTVSYRPHQLENRDNYEGFKKRFGNHFVVDDGRPFQDWLTRQHAVVLMKSTSIYESFLMGIPIITTEDMLPHLDEHMSIPNIRIPELRYCWRPKSFPEILSLVSKAAEDKLAVCLDEGILRDRIQQYFQFPRKKASSWIIAEEIQKECQKADQQGFYKKRSIWNDLSSIGARFVDRKFRAYEKKLPVKQRSFNIWKEEIYPKREKSD
ncbi:hypothetical protein ACFLT9_03065 [Acidobacteriota bacterium]